MQKGDGRPRRRHFVRLQSGGDIERKRGVTVTGTVTIAWRSRSRSRGRRDGGEGKRGRESPSPIYRRRFEEEGTMWKPHLAGQSNQIGHCTSTGGAGDAKWRLDWRVEDEVRSVLFVRKGRMCRYVIKVTQDSIYLQPEPERCDPGSY